MVSSFVYDFYSLSNEHLCYRLSDQRPPVHITYYYYKYNNWGFLL